MKKETLVEIVLANIGGALFAMGMCMMLIREWNLLYEGIGIIVIGIFCLITIIPVRRHNNNAKNVEWKSVITRFIMIITAIIIILGISQMIARKNMILGLIIWIIGLIVSTLSFPVFEFIEKDKLKIISTIIGTVGSILLIVGMTMTFIGYWNLMFSGTIIGLAGVILVIVFVYINKKSNEEHYYINVKFIAFVVIEVIGAFFTVFGIVKVGSSDASLANYHTILIWGLISCGIGFIISALAIPIYIYTKSNNIFVKELKINLKSKENDYSVRNLIVMFFFYGFVGWIVEFTFFGVTNGIFANRGFIHLPVLPIYGFGGVAVTIIFRKNQENVFIKSAIIVSVLEYITSVILEQAFGLRWWDYSNNPWNINGRICLLNCLMFGLGGYACAKFISPCINIKLNKRNPKLILVIAIIIVTAVGGDFIYTIFNPHVGKGVTTTDFKSISLEKNEICLKNNY